MTNKQGKSKGKGKGNSRFLSGMTNKKGKSKGNGGDWSVSSMDFYGSPYEFLMGISLE